MPQAMMQVSATNPTQAAEAYAMVNRATDMSASTSGSESSDSVREQSVFAGVLAGMLEADPATDTTPAFSPREAAEKRETALRDAAEQLVATTFIMPLFSQLRNDPMASEMFHGGRGEKVFQQQLDQVLSDRISTGAGFELVDTVADYFAGRRGGAEQARSALNSAVAPVVDRMPEVDIHG